MAAILKTAAIFVASEMCDGPIAKNLSWGLLYMCAKFHAFIVKGTIPSKICPYLLYYRGVYCLYSFKPQEIGGETVYKVE